ncbi:MAG: ABC transporter substrate-binding protein [Duodenibacillus sp.]|nr:ABC transporter substrate-binding protein [Duodenibacillus sp.]
MNKRILVKAAVAAAALALGIGQAAAAPTVVKVAVVGDYVAQWDTVNKILAKDNIRVKLVRYSDYATPNRALNDGEVDLNAFQHKAFLANDCQRNGYKIVSIGDTIATPLRIYNNKSKIKSVKDFKRGDIIAIPSDLTNGGRALKLLEAAGLIEVDPAKGFVPNKTDILKYNVKIKIREAESGVLANILPDVAACLINGGNAFTAGLDGTKDAIFTENLDPAVNANADKLVNIIAAREADKDNPVYKKVVAAYQTPEVARTIKEAYKGAFLSMWPGAEN